MHSEPEQNALRDILRQIDLAQKFAQGQDRDAFSADIMRVYAVTRCLEIISEASRRLSEGLKDNTPVLLGGRVISMLALLSAEFLARRLSRILPPA